MGNFGVVVSVFCDGSLGACAFLCRVQVGEVLRTGKKMKPFNEEIKSALDGWREGIFKEVEQILTQGEDDRADLKVPAHDPVNHPAHYVACGIECIDVIEAVTQDMRGMDAVCTANVLKYLWRWPKKGGIESLKKARWYLDRLIEQKESHVREGRE